MLKSVVAFLILSLTSCSGADVLFAGPAPAGSDVIRRACENRFAVEIGFGSSANALEYATRQRTSREAVEKCIKERGKPLTEPTG